MSAQVLSKNLAGARMNNICKRFWYHRSVVVVAPRTPHVLDSITFSLLHVFASRVAVNFLASHASPFLPPSLPAAGAFNQGVITRSLARSLLCPPIARTALRVVVEHLYGHDNDPQQEDAADQRKREDGLPGLA